MKISNTRRNVGYSTVNRIVFTIRGILVLPIITQLIGVSDYGTWVYFTSIIGLVGSVGGLHSQGILIRFLPEGDDVQSFINVFSLSIVSACFFSIVFIILSIYYDMIGLVSNVPHDTELLLSVSYLIFIRIIWRPIGAFPRAKENIRGFEILRVARGLIETLTLTVALVLTESLANGFWAIGFSFTIMSLVAYIVYIPKGLTTPQISKFPEYLDYGLPVMLSNIATESLKDADKYLIAFLLTANALGIYGASYRIAGLLQNFTAVLKSTLYPAIVNAWEDENMNQITQIYSVIFTILIFLYPPAIVGLWSVSTPLFQVLTAEPITADVPTLLLLLAAGLVIKATGDVVQYVLMASKETRIITIVAITASVINIALNVVLLPTIGLVGAAIATAVAYAIESSLYYYFASQHINFDIRLDYLWRATAAALCMGAILSQLTMPSPEIALVSKVLLGIAIYAIVAFILNGFSLPREAITFDT